MISPDDPRAPKYWMYEESGVLRPAVEAYLNGEPLTAGQVKLMRLYLKQWIDSPVWDENPVADEDSKLDRMRTGCRNRSALGAGRELSPTFAECQEFSAKTNTCEDGSGLRARKFPAKIRPGENSPRRKFGGQ